jgi:hypothetical protein
LPDDVLFAQARLARSRLRRFACYGLLLYVPLALIPRLLPDAPYAPRSAHVAVNVYIAIMLGLSAMVVFAAIGVTQWPRMAPRLLIATLLPMVPFVGLALLHSRHAPSASGAVGEVNLFAMLPLLDEVAVRLDRDPEGAEQRRWLGQGAHPHDSWGDSRPPS